MPSGIRNGKRDWWRAAFRIIRCHRIFAKSRAMKPIFAAAWELVESAEQTSHVQKTQIRKNCYNS